MWDGSELRVRVFDDERSLLTTILISASNSPVMQQKIEAQEDAIEAPED